MRLRNLTFNGLLLPIITGISIDFVNGATLFVENCVIANNDGSVPQLGIRFRPTAPGSQLIVTDTAIDNNISGAAGGGIQVAPQAGGSAGVVLNRVRFGFNVTAMVLNSTNGAIGIQSQGANSLVHRRFGDHGQSDRSERGQWRPDTLVPEQRDQRWTSPPVIRLQDPAAVRNKILSKGWGGVQCREIKNLKHAAAESYLRAPETRRMKRILFLGAAHFQIPPIQYARAAGYYVLTCDNRPEGPGHLLAHESHNVSTVDQRGVLELARSSNIDGIVSFGSDVSALTAAVVAGALGLPGADAGTVEILTRKSRFRQFLSSKGLQQQRYDVFRLDNIEAAAAFVMDFVDSAVIKPVDSSGSKGVSVVHSATDIDSALAYAFSESRSGEVIIEEYIGRSGNQVCGDGYMDQSKLAFIELGDGHFHDNDGLLAPFAETFPSMHSKASLELLARKVETILAAAGYCKGPFNLDAIITRDGEPFIIEIGPRCGGNFIPTAIRLQTDVDMIAAAVEGCVDRAFVLDTAKVRSDRLFACYMLHSRSGGIFGDMHVDPTFCAHIVEKNLYLKRGARVPPFRTASDVIGNLILSFASQTEMLDKIANFGAYCWPEME